MRKCSICKTEKNDKDFYNERYSHCKVCHREVERKSKLRTKPSISFIYALRSRLDGEILYVGQSLQTINQRFDEHISSAFNRRNPNYNSLVSKEIRKQGWSNIEIVVLEDESVFNENLTEDYYIKMLKPRLNRVKGCVNRLHRFKTMGELVEHIERNNILWVV